MTIKEIPSTVLSIIILTRNRKDELVRAIQSCVDCTLPSSTEFVIIDNASEDGTNKAVESFFHGNQCAYKYIYLTKNIGAAAGRNEGYIRSNGKYVFFLDDDAYIDDPKQTFFYQMINYLENNNDISGITTTIYDTELGGNRVLIRVKDNKQAKYKKVLWFHCGSVLVNRSKSRNQENLFLHHVFKGMPELYPSLKSYFSGKQIIEMDDLRVIHEPSSYTRPDKGTEAIYHYTGGLHAKLIFYPLVTYPILYIMFSMRIIKHLGLKGLHRAYKKLSQLNKNLVRETVTLRKFVPIVEEFGFVNIF